MSKQHDHINTVKHYTKVVEKITYYQLLRKFPNYLHYDSAKANITRVLITSSSL